MALAFTSSGSQRVDVGSGASLDNVNTGSAIFLAKPSTGAGMFFQKGAFGPQGRLYMRFDGADFTLLRDRATTDLQIQTAFANFAAYSIDTWMWFAAVWDTAGANGDQKLYLGNLTASLAEPSSYSIAQTAGSGTAGDNSTETCFLGNQVNLTSGFPGSIARAILYNVVLTLAQLKAIQFGAAIFPGRIGHWELGFNGTGTQPDWSGNGNAGTVTGATVTAHAPTRIFPFGRLTAPAYTVAAGGGGGGPLLLYANNHR